MSLDVLERRLQDLEKKVLGQEGASPVQDQQGPEGGAAVALDALARSLGNAMERRADRVAPLMRRVAELELYLDPSFLDGERSAIDAEAKVALVLDREEELRRCSAMAARLDERAKVLDGEAFEAAAQLEPKLKELTRLQVEHAEKESTLSEETLVLMGKYNNIVEELSKSFVYYDLVLKQAEEKRDAKED